MDLKNHTERLYSSLKPFFFIILFTTNRAKLLDLDLYTENKTNLAGIKFADHSIREILTLSWGFNFADGPFRNILRISRMGTCPNFFKNFADR